MTQTTESEEPKSEMAHKHEQQLDEVFTYDMPQSYSHVFMNELFGTIKLYHLKYNKIDFVCGTMPQPSDTSVIFCAEAAYTAQCLEQFSHSNIRGDHVSGDYIL